ncbi:MAG TPA: DUF2948 family protein [Caulobacteraceae bacterium]|nr:DUF2948 family protein [Caulobacteraceae bacterium]
MSPPASSAARRLNLLADDEEDLKVLSAAVQDAVCVIGDIAYEPAERRLTVALNRFRWEDATSRRGGQRVRAALQFGSVLDVKAQRLRRDAKQAVLSLLSLTFEPGAAPGGAVILTFAGGGALRAEVECIDALLADLSDPWSTPRRPAHDLSES